MSLVDTIKKDLQNLNLKPSKGLGQNLLIHEGTYTKILEAGHITAEDIIIEIGPGLGTLTQYLAKTGAHVIAIEKDRKLIPYLQTKFTGQNIAVIEGDALTFDPTAYGLKPNGYKIIANIPYYITSRLLRTILEQWPQPKLIVLMIQREVAQRIVAKPPQMSLLAVSIQYYANTKIITKVPAAYFYPQPQVDSAIIQIIPRVEPRDRSFNSHFFAIVKAGFKEKRKQLLNNLSQGLKISKESIATKLTELNIDPRRRAETLTIKEWLAIAKTL